MHGIDDIRMNLCEELERYADKKDMTKSDLEAIQKLADTIKNLDKIEMADQYSHDGGEWNAMGSYGRNRGRSYTGNNYRRGRSYAGDGYAYADDLTTKMEEMMQRVSGKERSTLEEALEIIRR